MCCALLCVVHGCVLCTVMCCALLCVVHGCVLCTVMCCALLLIILGSKYFLLTEIINSMALCVIVYYIYCNNY